ncbi:MAG TPA: hypothetical protein VGC01_05200 [Mucilaginibacter sp.]
MKTIKISIIALVMVFAMQIANAQVRVGVRIGAPAPYHRVIVERPYGYYHRAYYPRRVVYGHRRYYGGRVGYRRHW